MADICHDLQIVFDHQHRARFGHFADEIGDMRDILAPHARHRLIEKQYLRVERKRGGDFKNALATVGKIGRKCIFFPCQANRCDQLLGTCIEPVE
ncbi:hypothetical protein D3C87_1634300 [compost metagenome]